MFISHPLCCAHDRLVCIYICTASGPRLLGAQHSQTLLISMECVCIVTIAPSYSVAENELAGWLTSRMW